MSCLCFRQAHSCRVPKHLGQFQNLMVCPQCLTDPCFFPDLPDRPTSLHKSCKFSATLSLQKAQASIFQLSH